MFRKREQIFDERLILLQMQTEQRGMPKPKIPKDPKTIVGSEGFDPIASALRQMHNTVVAEPVPEDFLAILSQIDAKIAASKHSQ